MPVDELLREAGFTIAVRIPGKEPLWRRNGELYSQGEAVFTALNEEPVFDLAKEKK